MKTSSTPLPDHPRLDELVVAVQASPKYRAISVDLVRTIGARELAICSSMKDAIKETKNKLHQVAGAYLDAKPRYTDWLAELRRAAAGEETGSRGEASRPAGESSLFGSLGADASPLFKRTCRRIMAHHASTRERLPILEQFYATIFAHIPAPRLVLDLACGLNPLAIPWMPLAPGARYVAYDLYSDLAEFLNGFFALAGVAGQAAARDLLSDPPRAAADVALLLKTLPVLDRARRDGGRDLLRSLSASYLVVSFPTASLGGRSRGMPAGYAAQFRVLAAAEGWRYEQLDIPGELVFLIDRR